MPAWPLEQGSIRCSGANIGVQRSPSGAARHHFGKHNLGATPASGYIGERVPVRAKPRIAPATVPPVRPAAAAPSTTKTSDAKPDEFSPIKVITAPQPVHVPYPTTGEVFEQIMRLDFNGDGKLDRHDAQLALDARVAFSLEV